MHVVHHPHRAALRRELLAPRLLAVATAVPPHRIAQGEAKAFARALFGEALGPEDVRLLEIFDHSGIEGRSACMPLEWYGEDHDFGETNELYVRHALSLSLAAAREALAAAGVQAREIDHIVFVSSTGVATPSLDARIAGPLGLRTDVRRTPLWGLGCAGGAAGLARARELALAIPGSRVLLIALELCTLTFQRRDLDRRNLVAASLFSDGAAAAVVSSEPAEAAAAVAPARGLELVDSQSMLWPDSLDVMGWTVDATGFHVVFSRDIPTIVRDQVRPSLEAFLDRHHLAIADVPHMIAHPGGPRVLAAYAAALGLEAHALRHSREVLRDHGNMSSPTCLFVLERTLRHGDMQPGDLGIIAALGPGFSAEYVLVRAA